MSKAMPIHFSRRTVAKPAFCLAPQADPP